MFFPQCETELTRTNYCSQCKTTIPSKPAKSVKPKSLWWRISLGIIGIIIIVISGFTICVAVSMALFYDEIYFWSRWTIFVNISLIAICGGLRLVFPSYRRFFYYLASVLIIIPCVVYAIYGIVAWTKYDLYWVLYGIDLLIIASGTCAIAIIRLSSRYYNRFSKRSLAIVLSAFLGAIVFIFTVYIDFEHLFDEYEHREAYVTFNREIDYDTIYSVFEENGYNLSNVDNSSERFSFFYYDENQDFSPHTTGRVYCNFYGDTQFNIRSTGNYDDYTYVRRQQAERWVNEEIDKITEIVESETELVHIETRIYDEWYRWGS